jgi:hypothetical protein
MATVPKAPLRLSWAAHFAATTVQFLDHSTAFLVPSVRRFPAVVPLTMLAVIPSIPAEAPRAALAAVCSMLDRPALTVLIEAFALSTFTWTTSSRLLSAAIDVVQYYVFRWKATSQRKNWNSTPSARVFQRDNLQPSKSTC